MQEMVSEFENELKKKNVPEQNLYSKIKETLTYAGYKVDIESIFSVVQGISSNITPKDMGYFAYYLIKNNFAATTAFSSSDIEHAKKLKIALEDFIKKKCELNKPIEELRNLYSKSYKALLMAVPGEKNSRIDNSPFSTDWRAFTTNYDIVFEDYCRNYVQLGDYFTQDGGSVNKIFNVGMNPQNPSLIKLHGSIDWRKESTGKILRLETKYTSYEIEGEVMMFPIQQKDLYLHPWITMFQDLKRWLKQSYMWVVIGYAFNDEFIFEVFKEALSNGNKMVIVNPEANHLKSRFPSKYHENIVVLPIKFGTPYFGPQIQDFFDNVKTLKIKLKTDANIPLAFSSSHQIQSYSILSNSAMNPTWYVNNNEKITPWNHDHPGEAEWLVRVFYASPFDKDIVLGIITQNKQNLEFSISYLEQTIKNIRGETMKVSANDSKYSSIPVTIPFSYLFRS